jgi:hypothetical protein
MSEYKAIVQLPDIYGQMHAAGGEVIIEQEKSTPRFIGLYNHLGQPLYRVAPSHPLGFDLTVRS